jgi:hypothetical protein
MYIITPSVSYLAAEAGGDQGGHDDHGDNDLDGGGNGSHDEFILWLRDVADLVLCEIRCCHTFC